MNTSSYTCRRMPDGCDHQDLQQIGDFSWRYLDGEVAGMVIAMPGADGQPQQNWIAVSRGAPVSAPGTNAWGWDGNLDAPTLQPSLLLHHHWHGFMRAGRLESC